MKEKLSLMTDLIKLAQCDHELREQEYQFLLTISQSLGISQENFDHLFEKYIDFDPQKSEFDRILQFQRLVLLMNIDQEPCKSEMDYVKDIGIRMGLNPMATNLVLSEMNKYPDKIIPPEKMIEIFKGQYN